MGVTSFIYQNLPGKEHHIPLSTEGKRLDVPELVGLRINPKDSENHR